MADLPYQDTKTNGAAGFYSGINATFRFLLRRFGEEGWRRQIEEMGRDYFGPVNAQWRQGGLPAVARYWRAFFAAEPGARVDVVEAPDRVAIRVEECPALRHLRAAGKSVVPQFCRHCFYLGAARAGTAGLQMRLAGGNGSCVHTYARPDVALPPQELAAIKEVSP